MNRLALSGLAALCLAAPWLATPGAARAQDNTDQDLAKKLSNPAASLISVPLQLNYDCCFGPSDGGRYTLNVQPVIPVSISPNWNLIIRTIVPVIYQDRTSPQTGSATGLGDVTQSFFFSPKAVSNGVVWAVGPALLWPTGENELGSKAWGAGPTALLLKQQGGATYGVLANHIWSYADLGDNNHPGVSSTFVQPFFSWTNPKATTYGVNAESTYNWKTSQWSIPINFSVSHLYKFGGQRVSLGGGFRVYAARDTPSGGGGGSDWGLRFVATLLYPE